MRHGAEQQFREQHAVGSVVFGVFRFAGDLRDQIGRGVVVSDVPGGFCFSHVMRSS